jgi:hypothetical protein
MVIVETINSDLKGNGELLEILIEKPSDYKSFAKKWEIKFEICDTFELFLANKINTYIPKRSYIQDLARGLERLNIPIEVPVKLLVYTDEGSIYLHLDLLNSSVKIDEYRDDMPF